MSFRLPCICNLKQISVLSGCLSMPDATSLHMLYQEFNLYILRVSRSLCSNTRKVVPNPSSFFLVDFMSKFSSSNLVVVYFNIQVVRLYAMHIIIKLVCNFHIIAISRRNFLAMVSKRQLHIQNLETKNKLVSLYRNLWLVLSSSKWA